MVILHWMGGQDGGPEGEGEIAAQVGAVNGMLARCEPTPYLSLSFVVRLAAYDSDKETPSPSGSTKGMRAGVVIDGKFARSW